jgi:hypothetical protein
LYARDVRRDQNAGQPEQRMPGRKRLGVGDVEDRVEPAARALRGQRLGVEKAPHARVRPVRNRAGAL